MARDGDEVAADGLHVHGSVRRRLSRVDDDDRAVPMRPLDDPLDAVDRAERVRHEVERDDLQPRVADELVEPVEHEVALVGERDHPELGARALRDVLPGDEVRVVLELGDEDDVPRAEVREPPRVRDEVDALGGVADEDHLARGRRVQQHANLLARGLEALRRALRELVDAAVDVRVRGLVERLHRLEHLPRLLGARGGVEVRERLSVELLLEDREVLAQRVRIELGAGRYGHCPIVAPCLRGQRDAPPDASAAARVGLEAGAAHDVHHELGWMRVRPEVRAAHAQPDVHEPEQGARDDVARRVREDDRLPRLLGRRAEQPLVVRIAADDAVEDDDVGRLRAVRGEVADVPLHALCDARLPGELRGDLLVARRQLDHRRVRGARLQQLDLDGADAASRLEDAPALDPLLAHGVDDPARRPCSSPFSLNRRAARRACSGEKNSP